MTNVEPPRTDFDVDLHEPRAGETYQAISKLHYGDPRYADALREFNRGLDLGGGAEVKVPPMYILRKRYPNLIGRASAESSRGDDWSPSSSNYVVRTSGLTLRDVAKELFGDDREWRRLAELNPRFEPGSPLPEGTRLLLPPDTRTRR